MGEKNIILYSNDVQIAGLNSNWVQKTLTAVVRMFERVGLQTNPRKANEMVCTPDLIWGQKIEAAYNLRVTGKKGKFGERKRTRASCEEYGATMEALLILHHMERSHRRAITQTRGVCIDGEGQYMYVFSFPCMLTLVACPVEG